MNPTQQPAQLPTQSQGRPGQRSSVRLVPTPDQVAAHTQQPHFSCEEDFTRRLAHVMSDSVDGTSQTWLAAVVKQALILSQRARISDEQFEMLHASLHAVTAPVRSTPDVVLANEQHQIVWVIEAKGRTTSTQWTPMAGVRTRPVGDTGWAEFIASHTIAPSDPTWDTAHADDTDCGCRLREDLRGNTHCNSLHQGDCYVALRDWVPTGYTLHPDAVWTVLLPSPYSVWDWRQNLVSADLWNITRIRTLHTALLDTPHTTGTSHSRLTDYERTQFQQLVTALHAYYELDTPSTYSDDEWETYYEPSDDFVPHFDAEAQQWFGYAAWQDEPLNQPTFRAYKTLVRGTCPTPDGYDDYLTQHAAWRAAGGSAADHAAAAQRAEAEAAAAYAADGYAADGYAHAAHVPPPSKGSRFASAVGRFALEVAVGVAADTLRERSQPKRYQPKRAGFTESVFNSMTDNRTKWQRDADELRRLRLKEARKRNGAWW